MDLRQLKALCEVIDRGLTISGAAESLHRTQPSITRQIQELERELGVELFVRRRNKILAVSPAGQQIVAIARRMLEDGQNMRRVSEELLELAAGDFLIATTHTQARYTLPQVINKFMSQYPRVRLRLRQGTPAQCCELVAQGRADIAVCTETSILPNDVVSIPCYWLSRSVVTPLRHPLLRVKPLSLKAICRYPIITYDEGFSARSIIDKVFAENNLSPTVVLSAIDADVSKAYVEMGLGIAILATIAFDAGKERNLRRIDVRRLFPSSTLAILVRRNTHLRGYMRRFMQLFAPALKNVDIDRATSGQKVMRIGGSLPTL
jgi:LysR family transcriptional regulator, cys regulon transcriptional activator